MLNEKVCREVDDFFIGLSTKMPSNKNVELGGRDGFKYFKHGVSSYMLPKVRRINGGWWISIARQLQIFFVSQELSPMHRAPSSVTRCPCSLKFTTDYATPSTRMTWTVTKAKLTSFCQH
jgi:hypothetical protein